MDNEEQQSAACGDTHLRNCEVGNNHPSSINQKSNSRRQGRLGDNVKFKTTRTLEQSRVTIGAREELTRPVVATHPLCSPKLNHVSSRPSPVKMRAVSKQPNVTKQLYTHVEAPTCSFELVWDNFGDCGYDSICHPDRYITNIYLHDAHSQASNGSSCFISLPRRGVSSCGALTFTVCDSRNSTLGSTQSSGPMKDRRKNVLSNYVNVLQTAFCEEEDEFFSDCSTEYFSCNSCSSNSDFSSQKKSVEQQQIECVFSKVKINMNIIVNNVDQTVDIECQKWIKEQKLDDSSCVRASNSSLAVDVGSFSANHSLSEPCRSVSESVLNTRPCNPDDGTMDRIITASIIDLPSIKSGESQNIDLTLDDFVLTDEYIEDEYVQYVADTAMLSKNNESEDLMKNYSIKLNNFNREESFEGARIEDEQFQFPSTLGDKPSQPNVETQDPFGKTIDYIGGIDVLTYPCGGQEDVVAVHENKVLYKDVYEDLTTHFEIEISDSDASLSKPFVAREASFKINFDAVRKEVASTVSTENVEFRETSNKESVYGTSTKNLLLSDCKQSRIEDNEQIIACSKQVDQSIQPNVKTLDPLCQMIDNRRDINISTQTCGSQEDDVIVYDSEVLPENTFKDLATWEVAIVDSDVDLREKLVAAEETKCQQQSSEIHLCDQEKDISVNENKTLLKDTFECIAEACEMELGDSDVSVGKIIGSNEESESVQHVIRFHSCDQNGDIVVNDNKILRKDTFDCIAADCEREFGGRELEVNLSENIAAPDASDHQQQVIKIQSCDQDGDIVVNDKKLLHRDTFDCLASACEIELGVSDVSLSEVIALYDETESQEQIIGKQTCEITHQQNEKIIPFVVDFDEQWETKMASKRINNVHCNERRYVLGAKQEKANVLKEKQDFCAAIPDLGKISKTLCKNIIYATRVEIAEERLALEYKRQRAKRQMHAGLTKSTSMAVRKKSKMSNKSIARNSLICSGGGQCKCNRCAYRVKHFHVSKIPVESGKDTTEKEYVYKIQSKNDAPRVNIKKQSRQTSCHISRCMHNKLFIPEPIAQYKTSDKARYKVRSQSKYIKPKKSNERIPSILKNEIKTDSEHMNQNANQTYDIFGGKQRLLSCSILPANFMRRANVEQPEIGPALEGNVDNEKTD